MRLLLIFLFVFLVGVHCGKVIYEKKPEVSSIQLDRSVRQTIRPDPGQPGHCTPGERFMDKENCNWCTCHKTDGRYAFCTDKLCPPPQ